MENESFALKIGRNLAFCAALIFVELLEFESQVRQKETMRPKCCKILIEKLLESVTKDYEK